ncbi:unnamed protein product [Moneuplotes crassus]|uniref:Uncharacterized protein n=2 Tax=Euplotes crassus TaxID=5936 RepID=A0AAD1Y507_EUPCR|nr:unnamed protein product [Moneuplotes crassus]
MKGILFVTMIVLIVGINARSFNNYSRTNPEKTNAMNLKAEEGFAHFYFGWIRGWQTQQLQAGQCYHDNNAFFFSLNDTFTTFLHAYRPDIWFNFLDRIRINIDNFAKLLQSCQVHSILLKVERIVTQEGFIEISARLITQIVFLQNNIQAFQNHLAAGEFELAGVELGKFVSAVVGVTVN